MSERTINCSKYRTMILAAKMLHVSDEICLFSAVCSRQPIDLLTMNVHDVVVLTTKNSFSAYMIDTL